MATASAAHHVAVGVRTRTHTTLQMFELENELVQYRAQNVALAVQVCSLYIGYILASPTACLLRGYGRRGTHNDRLGKAVILSTSTSIPAQ